MSETTTTAGDGKNYGANTRTSDSSLMPASIIHNVNSDGSDGGAVGASNPLYAQLTSAQIASIQQPVMQASENHVGTISGTIIIASGNFTRPANTTGYTNGQVIANSVTAGSCVPITLAVARINNASFMIRKLRLKVNDTAWLNATVRVHLYKNSPTYSNGDGGTWLTTESAHIGYADILLNLQFSDPVVKGIGVPSFGSEWNDTPSSGTQNIFAVLETLSAVTPASASIWTLVAETHQN